MVKWRRFQQEIIDKIEGMKSRRRPLNELILDAIPGAGKASAGPIVASLLIPSHAEAICWVVPRRSLQRQAERVFHHWLFREALGHRLEIRMADNTKDPSRGTAGYVTTYQAIASNPDLHRHEFERRRYILFLDEPHHLWLPNRADNPEQSSWTRSIQPLVERAVFRIYASGTFERWDGKPIPFLPYRSSPEGAVIDWNETDSRAVIRYRLKDALAEEAIVPIHFDIVDGRGEYVDHHGSNKFNSFVGAGKETNMLLFTALRTEYALHLLERCVADWVDHRRNIDPDAKLLVVAGDIALAKEYLKILRSPEWIRRWPELAQTLLATSDDSDHAADAIDQFKGQHRRKRAVHSLVTVQMAYEGLDVPAITHIAVLTHIRSKPWLWQCFARAIRLNPPHKRFARVFTPDDDLIREVIQAIQAEQEAVINLQEGNRNPRERKPGDGNGDLAHGLIALASEATRQRQYDLSNGETLAHEELESIRQAMADQGIPLSVSPLQFKRAMIQAGYIRPREDDGNGSMDEPLLTPSEREANLRSHIEQYVRKTAYHVGTTPDVLNRELIEKFQKSRREMSFEELVRVWKYLHDTYPEEWR